MFPRCIKATQSRFPKDLFLDASSTWQCYQKIPRLKSLFHGYFGSLVRQRDVIQQDVPTDTYGPFPVIVMSMPFDGLTVHSDCCIDCIPPKSTVDAIDNYKGEGHKNDKIIKTAILNWTLYKDKNETCRKNKKRKTNSDPIG